MKRRVANEVYTTFRVYAHLFLVSYSNIRKILRSTIEALHYLFTGKQGEEDEIAYKEKRREQLFTELLRNLKSLISH